MIKLVLLICVFVIAWVVAEEVEHLQAAESANPQHHGRWHRYHRWWNDGWDDRWRHRNWDRHREHDWRRQREWRHRWG
ncbi:hypothetical protein FQR65_LT03167 [Abscondita terminalis]|nr:hypothetical protein FQR65_LT03167 [Abscondita terminalis]